MSNNELSIIETSSRTVTLSEERIRNQAKKFGVESIEYANILRRIGSFKQNQEDYKNSFPILLECLLIYEKLSEKEMMTIVLQDLAFVWMHIQNNNNMDDEYDSEIDELIIPSLKTFSVDYSKRLNHVALEILQQPQNNLTCNQLNTAENLVLFSQAIQHQNLYPEKVIDHPSMFFNPPKINIDLRLIPMCRIFSSIDGVGITSRVSSRQRCVLERVLGVMCSAKKSTVNACRSFGFDRKTLGSCSSKFDFYLQFILQKPLELGQLYLNTLQLLIRVLTIGYAQQQKREQQLTKTVPFDSTILEMQKEQLDEVILCVKTIEKFLRLSN
jgi:hypothetical protein